MLDRLGVEPGDRVPVLRPTVCYWTSNVIKNQFQQIDDIDGLQNCHIIDWDQLAETRDIIWFESKELCVRKKELGKELSVCGVKKCLPAIKTTVGVSKGLSTVGANKGASGARFNPFSFPFTRLAIDHLNSDELRL
ncbi:hypothetical protein LINGRAHAP2_LOCUS14556 [Linum grandiflorum]